MKTEIITQDTPPKPDDWSKVRLVKFNRPSEEYTILANGDADGEEFSGMVISSNESSYYKVGHFSKRWHKPSFIAIAEPVTIKFTPENE